MRLCDLGITPERQVMLIIARKGLKDANAEDAVCWDRDYAEAWQRYGYYRPTSSSTNDDEYTVEATQSMITCWIEMEIVRCKHKRIFGNCKHCSDMRAYQKSWNAGKPIRLGGEYEAEQKRGTDFLIQRGLMLSTPESRENWVNQWISLCEVGVHQNYRLPNTYRIATCLDASNLFAD